MSTGTIVFIITMGFSLLIHGGLTYLIAKKKDYSLISGFSNRPKEEQEELIRNGFPQALGKLFQTTFVLLLLSFILYFLPIPYGFAISFGAFTVIFLVGIIYIHKFEVKSKRKRAFWLGGFFTVLFVGIGILFIYSIKDETITITDNQIKISGIYGVEWTLSEIEQVQLLDELPKVDFKSNGFAAFDRLKGSFHLEAPYGEGKLFIYKNYPPYLYLEGKNQYIILNRKNSQETENLYQQLIKKLKLIE